MPAECAAVIKADGYGCGIEKVAAALAKAGCKTFFVADLAEARQVRNVAPDPAIYVLNGLLSGTAGSYADIRARPVIGSMVELAEWDAFVSVNQWHGGAFRRHGLVQQRPPIGFDGREIDGEDAARLRRRRAGGDELVRPAVVRRAQVLLNCGFGLGHGLGFSRPRAGRPCGAGHRCYRPSVTSAQCRMVLLLRNSMTLGSMIAGRSCATTTVATMASQ